MRTAPHNGGRLFLSRPNVDYENCVIYIMELAGNSRGCCLSRTVRLNRLVGIRTQIGYKRRSGTYGGRPSVVVDRSLDRRFDVVPYSLS